MDAELRARPGYLEPVIRALTVNAVVPMNGFFGIGADDWA